MEVIGKSSEVLASGTPSPATEIPELNPDSPTPPMGQQIPAPCWQQFERVQKVLEGDRRLREYLSPKTHVVEKNTGEEFKFSPVTAKVVYAFFREGKNTVKAGIVEILRMAVSVLNLRQTGQMNPGLVIVALAPIKKWKLPPTASELLPERNNHLAVWIRSPKVGVERYTGLSRAKLYQLAGEGKIKSASLREPGRVRGCRLFLLSSILDYIEANQI